MTTSSASLFETARLHVEAQLKAQQDVKRRRLISKRLEYVTQGVRAFQAKKVAEAAVYFQSYIRLMEEHKGVPDGALAPSLFKAADELGDLLLLSGVYWDLTKIFDRTQSPEKNALFNHYMEKFILFSKNTPYQPVCAEGLRRYITAEKPVHPKSFKMAYKMLGVGKCFVVSSLLDVTDPQALPLLCRFRDECLAKHAPGRAFIALYYRLGPAAADGVDRMPAVVRRGLGRSVSWLAFRINRYFLV